MSFKVTTLEFALASAIAMASAAAGQTGPTPQPEPRRIEAARLGTRAVQLDGRLDDEVWRGASFLSGFVQREPEEGQPARNPTEIAFAYDEDALYVGARMHSADPAGIRALVTRRDREGSVDQLVVSLDTYRDRRTAYTFAVTAAGVRVDYYHSGDFEGARDYTFDPVWEAETEVDSLGWSAELRIPFTQLRFSARDEQVWGVNIVRLTPSNNEQTYWVLVRRNDTGWSSRMGELTGITGIRPSRRIEAVPYVATEATLATTTDARNPFDRSRDSQMRAGGDLKMGLGPSLTLDATFNPDFGQVEADPAEVNLSAFETFFAERRPFFTEGTQLFAGRGNFYSRRIGAPPPGQPGGTYAKSPSNSTILGAAKVAGRLPSGLSLGALSAVTAREYAETFDTVAGSFGRTEVAPLTGYGVVSMQQEFGANASTAALVLTAVERDIEEASPLQAAVARRAYTGLADTRIRWRGGQYDMSAFWGFSLVEGDSLALLGLQRSSRRYYQRPDADHVEVDPSRTSLFGYRWGINHSKLSGKHWLWDIDYGEESPGLELNDVGQLGAGDDRSLITNIRYRENQPGRLLRSYNAGFFHLTEWNFGGVRNFTILELYGNATFHNFWSLGFYVDAYPRALSDNLTRGGPLMGTGAGWSAGLNFSNASASKTRWRANLNVDEDELGGWSTSLNGGISIRPGSRWELSVDPRYSRGVAPRQFITSLSANAPATFGRRYVFSYVDRSEMAARIRLNYALTPDLTLETYAEPFASSGRFFDFGELAAARSRDLRTYGTDGTTITRASNGSYSVTDGSESFTLANRDFDVHSFRSNTVLRWEWRPGSTLFLVWQQNRSSSDAIGRRVRPGDLWDSLSAQGSHFLALKASYWLPVN